MMASPVRILLKYNSFLKSYPNSSTSSILRRKYVTEAMKKKMELMQVDDGVPVYIKGGIGDKILLGISCVLVVLGLVDGFYSMYRLATKQ
ncbi:hypothetical protein HHI36_007306 [Cryptolaemus montrouzieri]|uniref:Cytochrome c oxidase subunit VIIa n=1 Tax=Cryptolaemus montrouzieri TaxID=559131 RepID=A0ABD2MP62_9CUCU